MATPEQPDDADNPLRLVFGNEANDRDIEDFARRFGCVVVDSYSLDRERRDRHPRARACRRGSLGRPLDGVAVLDPETMHGERRTRSSTPPGALLNAEAGDRRAREHRRAPATSRATTRTRTPRRSGCATACTGPATSPTATPTASIYFAGRTADWLRVDGENLAAAPIERILLRHPAVDEAAVYAVPDESVGDQVMAALVLRRRLAVPRRPRGVPGRPAGPLPQGLAALRPRRSRRCRAPPRTRCSSASWSRRARSPATACCGCARSAGRRTSSAEAGSAKRLGEPGFVRGDHEMNPVASAHLREDAAHVSLGGQRTDDQLRPRSLGCFGPQRPAEAPRVRAPSGWPAARAPARPGDSAHGS